MVIEGGTEGMTPGQEREGGGSPPLSLSSPGAIHNPLDTPLTALFAKGWREAVIPFPSPPEGGG